MCEISACELNMFSMDADYDYEDDDSFETDVVDANDFCLRPKKNDAVLQLKRTQFLVNRSVLSETSGYFKALFSSVWAESRSNEIVVRDVEPEIFVHLVRYAYTKYVDINPDDVVGLVFAANYLQFEEVEKECRRFMYKTIDRSNCVKIYLLSLQLSYDVLNKLAVEFIRRNFVDVIQYDDILELTSDQLVEFLRRDQLEVLDEDSLYWLAIQWLYYAPVERAVDFIKVWKCIRLPLLSLQLSFYALHNEPVVFESEECRSLLVNSIEMLSSTRKEQQKKCQRHGFSVDYARCISDEHSYAADPIKI